MGRGPFVPSDAGWLPEMVQLPVGTFRMGDDNGPLIQRPAHRVEVSRFAMGIAPVTRGQYAAFLEKTNWPPPVSWENPRFGEPLQPVVSVNWFDAVAYCEWLSGVTGDHYRLPTEAEREYAARGGLEGRLFPWGDEYPHPATAYHPGVWDRPLPVRSGEPNGFGLYNMADTVHEWCQDYYAEDYYQDSPEKDPPGPAAGARRVARGGAWRHQVPVSRCAHRTSLPPDRCFTDFGFRVVRSLVSYKLICAQIAQELANPRVHQPLEQC